jgi:NitT/TauT family transport system substrate-binding protein
VLPIANPDIENLMRKGQLDAAWLPEPWASRLVDQGIARVIARESDLWPEGTFGLTNVIVRRQFLEERPDLVRAFLRTHLALTDEIGADPAAHAATINAHMAAITGKTLREEVMASALASIRLTAEIDRNGFARFLEHGQGLGYLPTARVPALEGLFDDRLLEETRLAALPAATGVPAP